MSFPFDLQTSQKGVRAQHGWLLPQGGEATSDIAPIALLCVRAANRVFRESQTKQVMS